MSHITRRKSAIKDVATLKKACERIGAKYLGRVQKARGASMGGHQVQLKDWQNPVTIDTNTGECVFDNYGGRWGKESELDSLKQGYAVEATKAQAEVEGHEFEEQRLSDGSIKCTIPLGGGGYETEDGGASEGGYSV